MSTNVFLISLISIIVLMALIGAVTLILIFFLRNKIKSKDARSKKELSPEQVDEITSTWNLLNH